MLADLRNIYSLHGNTGPTAPTANNTKPFSLMDVVKYLPKSLSISRVRLFCSLTIPFM